MRKEKLSPSVDDAETASDVDQQHQTGSNLFVLAFSPCVGYILDLREN